MIPNLISLSRIIFIFPIILCIILDKVNLAIIIFLVASLTDFLDGYFARFLNQESILGANLDLLADKIFVCSLLVFISFHFDNFIFLSMTILILCRELSIGSIRQYLIQTEKENKAKVNFLGKFKTFFQFFSLGLAIIFLDSEYSKIVEFFIIVTAILSWLSLINYTYARD